MIELKYEFAVNSTHAKDKLDDIKEWLKVHDDCEYVEHEDCIEIRRKRTTFDELSDLHNFLNDTDYVIIKIYEASILGNTQLVNSLKQTYSNVLSQRQLARQKINELELLL